MAATAATLLIKVITDTKGAVAGVDNVSKSTTSFKDKVAGAAKVAGVALLGLGAAAISAGKAAAEDAQSQAILANTLKNSAGATSAQVKATEDWISKTSMATGVADDELRPALGNLVRATGDVSKSQKAMQTALDISAATGKSLSTVTTAMAKGYGGNVTALNKLLPSVTKTATATGDFDKVMQKAADTTRGAAAASANTAAGQMKVFDVAINETQESMGTALLPVMQKFATMAASVAVWVQKNSTLFQILVGVIAAVAAAVVVLNAALKVYEVTTKVIGVVSKATWLSNPIFLVVAAVIAVGVAIVVLYKKSKTFRDFVNKMWAGIKAGARAAASVFKAVWQTAVAAVKGYVQAWIAYFRLVLNVIKGVVKVVVSVFKGDWRGAFDAIRGIINSFRDFFRSIFNLLPGPVQKVITKIKDGLGGAFDWLVSKMSGLGSVLAGPFNFLLGAINDVIGVIRDLIGWISKIHIPNLGSALGKLNPFSAVAVAPQSASVARGVVAPSVLGAKSSTRAMPTGGAGINITVTGAIDPEATARQIKRILEGHDRRVGLRTA